MEVMERAFPLEIFRKKRNTSERSVFPNKWKAPELDSAILGSEFRDLASPLFFLCKNFDLFRYEKQGWYIWGRIQKQNHVLIFVALLKELLEPLNVLKEKLNIQLE